MNMNLKKILKALLILSLLLFFLFYLFTQGSSNDLTASLAQLPGLADTPDKGAFVDLVKAIDEVYTEGRIKIEIYPFARSVDNVLEGKADFHVPSIKNPQIPELNLPYRFVKEKMGSVRFVIYSHVDKKITKNMIDAAQSKKGDFSYKFEVPAGLEDNFPFPVIPSNNIDQSFKKVDKKRIDALLWAQEESDLTLRQLKIKTIHREFWIAFDDVIIIPKGPEGDKTDKIISSALKKLKSSGKLDEIYSKVHRPYEDWQPSEMGW